MSDTATLPSVAATANRLVNGTPFDAANNPRPDAPTADANLAAQCHELFHRAREARRDQLPQWRRNYSVLNNRDYRPAPHAWDESPAINQIWPVVASSVAWLTDQRTEIRVAPTAESGSEFWEQYNRLAQDLNTVIASVWLNYLLDAELSRAWWDVYTYGVGYLKTGWEAPLADGMGDAAFRRVDPYTLYPDPIARSADTLSYIIEARKMTIADAERAWPGAEKLLRSSFLLEDTPEAPTKIEDQINRDRPRTMLDKITGAGVPVNTPANHARVHGDNRFTDSPVITVLECYLRGTEIEGTDPTTGVVRVRDVWHNVVVSGNAILQNVPCTELNSWGGHPYDRLVLADNGEWYGPCMVEFLTPLQKIINWLLGSMLRNLYLAGNPQIAESPGQSTLHQITNRPGQRISTHPSDIAWMQPPQIHPNVSTDIVAFLKGEIETISGLSAMVRGFAPGGRNAQGVLDSIQDAAFVRVRMALREMERSLRNVATKMAATVAEFYDEPRLVSIIGPDGQRTAQALNSRHFYGVDPEDPQKLTPLRFSVVGDAGSSLPTSKQARAAEVKHLYELGVVDEYEVLKTLEWPQFALVVQRVMQQKAQMAMAEQQAAAAP